MSILALARHQATGKKPTLPTSSINPQDRIYYFRVWVEGRLIPRSLKNGVLSVAKLRLTDEEKKQR